MKSQPLHSFLNGSLEVYAKYKITSVASMDLLYILTPVAGEWLALLECFFHHHMLQNQLAVHDKVKIRPLQPSHSNRHNVLESARQRVKHDLLMNIITSNKIM